jgi:ribonuclease P protein component
MLFALERKETVSGSSGTLGVDPVPVRTLPRRARVGFTVSRKVGGAVVRNRVRRWLRESCRRWQGTLGSGPDLVIIARPSAASASYQTTLREVQGLLGRLERR